MDVPSIYHTNMLKANALVNTAIESCAINDLGVVVLDELHMINDDHRGYLMELMASKILVLERPVQLVGMSATLTVWSDRFAAMPWLTRKEYRGVGEMAECQVLQHKICTCADR